MTDTIGNTLVPGTREELITLLLDEISSRSQGEYPHTLLDLIMQYPNHEDPYVQEIRTVRLALELIDVGATILATSPLHEDIERLSADLMRAVQALDTEGLERTTQLAVTVLNMYEAALTDNKDLWDMQFDTKDLGQVHIKDMRTLKERLLEKRIRYD